MADADKLSALTTFFRRFVKDNETLTYAGTNYTGRNGLKGISKVAAQRILSGSTLVEIIFEGESSRGVVNVEAHILLDAAEAILEETDEDNECAGLDTNSRFLDFSGGRIET